MWFWPLLLNFDKNGDYTRLHATAECIYLSLQGHL